MSISGEMIKQIVSDGRLYPLQPFMPPSKGVVPREMYLSKEINSLFVGPWHNDEWEERCAYLRADLDRFVQGGMIPVAKYTLSGGKHSYLRQLFQRRDEVWEIRSRDPQPGIRVLGRFADTDVFIALSWWHRANLGGPKNRAWRDAIVGCKTEWKNLFPAYEPKSSGDENVYPVACISANTILV
jgi:hypothetical protein